MVVIEKEDRLKSCVLCCAISLRKGKDTDTIIYTKLNTNRILFNT